MALNRWGDDTSIYDNRLMRNLKKIYLVFIVIAFIVGVFLMNWNSKRRLINDELSRDFTGTVYSKFRDTPNHVAPSIVVNDTKYHINSSKLYENINPGDTIIKHANSFKYQLIRMGDTLVYYPEADWAQQAIKEREH